MTDAERPIVLDRGCLIRVGPDRPVVKLGWAAIQVVGSGIVTVASNDGGPRISYQSFPAAELLWRNPRYLALQVVEHPDPPAGMSPSGWTIVPDQSADTTVVLDKDGCQSIVDAIVVVMFNRVRLVARLQIVGDT